VKGCDVIWAKREDTVVHQESPFNAEPTRAALAEADITPVEVFNPRP
jgi:sulfite oxidase